MSKKIDGLTGGLPTQVPPIPVHSANVSLLGHFDPSTHSDAVRILPTAKNTVKRRFPNSSMQRNARASVAADSKFLVPLHHRRPSSHMSYLPASVDNKLPCFNLPPAAGLWGQIYFLASRARRGWTLRAQQLPFIGPGQSASSSFRLFRSSSEIDAEQNQCGPAELDGGERLAEQDIGEQAGEYRFT